MIVFRVKSPKFSAFGDFVKKAPPNKIFSAIGGGFLMEGGFLNWITIDGPKIVSSTAEAPEDEEEEEEITFRF